VPSLYSLLAVVTLATGVKLASSSDDVIWFLPFLSRNTARQKLINSVLYLLTLQAVMILSLVLSQALLSGMDLLLSITKLPWHPERAIQVLSGLLLILVAVYYFYQERNDMGETEEQTGPGSGSVVLITFLGSLDELSYFPGLLAAGTFTPVELGVGVVLAGTIVVSVCLGITGLRSVITHIEKVPLWLIMGAIASLMLVGIF